MSNTIIEQKWEERAGGKPESNGVEMSKSSNEYVHLHLHTHLSMMDGCMHHEVLFDKLKEQGVDKVAVTNHGNIINMPKIMEQGAKEGIQVIPGCEVYMTWDYPCTIKDDNHRKVYHMVLLAMNDKGYQNLLRITSAGHLIGKYYKPRIDKEILEKYSEGIIVLSACLQGVFANKVVQGGMTAEELKPDVDWFKDIFDDRFYFEIQRHPELEIQEQANKVVLELAKIHDIPVVATCDAHYAVPEHFEAWKSMMLLSTKGKFGHDAVNDYYVKTPTQMLDLYSDMPEVCAETVRVANRCTPIHFDKAIKYPPFDTAGRDPTDVLREICLQGLEQRITNKELQRQKKLEYIERLEYELGILHEKNFSTYLLIVSDFTIWAKEQGIYMSPGRGSGAGSLACYLSRITEVDPLSFGLIFERFINPERNSFPDIDQDFQDDRRDEVKEYMSKKYGEDKVASIGTIGTLGAKAAIKEIMRRFEIPPSESNAFTKAVPPMIRGRAPSISDCLTDDGFKEKLAEKPIYKEVIRIAQIIEGMAKSSGIHAAGLVVTDGQPLTDVVGVQTDKNGKVYTSDTMKPLEDMGYIKFDFLGLTTQTTIKNTIDYIEKNHGIKLDYQEIPRLHDEKVYDMICRGDLAGVFQISGSDGFVQVCRQMKPRDIEGISDINAIYRPGPLDNGFVEEYVANHKRVEKGQPIKYMMVVDNPDKQLEIEKILKPTYGVCLYQEQIQFIAQKVAGYTLGGADLLRRAIGKKDEKVMEAERKGFIKGCLENGVSEKSAADLFNQIAKFADYCFNKSHSVAYSMISYTTAWLKYYYPEEFYAACLSEVKDNKDKTIKFLYHLKESGIKILPPDVNQSDKEYTPGKKEIRFGLSAIKGLGESTILPILKNREEKGKFLNFKDFIVRVSQTKVKKSDFKTLILTGSTDSLN